MEKGDTVCEWIGFQESLITKVHDPEEDEEKWCPQVESNTVQPSGLVEGSQFSRVVYGG